MPEVLKSAFVWFNWRSTLSYLSIFIIAGFIGNLWMTRDQTEGLAPVISGQAIDGTHALQDFKKLKSPVLVYFFAEWCPICKVQHSVIEGINESYPVIGIAMQSGTLDAVKKYVNDRGIKFDVVNDASGMISADYGVNGVPASFIVDTQGIIQYSTRGYATEAGLRSRLWLAESKG